MDLEEAHCFGCWEYRSRLFCCWRCFGITKVEDRFGFLFSQAGTVDART